MLFSLKMNEDDVCIANYATTHTIFRDKRYFLEVTLIKTNVSIIFGTTNLVKDSKRANIMLPNGTRFHINDALYFRKSKINLLSLKDICRNEPEAYNGNTLDFLIWVVSYNYKAY